VLLSTLTAYTEKNIVPPEDFTPRSSEAAARLDQLLGEYCRRCGTPLLPHFSLETISKLVRNHPESGRIFDFCVEVQLQVAILQIDLARIGKSLRRPEATPLSDEDTFCHKMDVLRMNSDYIFRYRAIWDKVMSVIVLFVAPSEFEKFNKAGSRKVSFLKIAGASQALPSGFVDHILKTTEAFDKRFRTSEVHGSGSARRWVTGELEGWDSIQADMFWASNSLNKVLVALGAVFREPPP